MAEEARIDFVANDADFQKAARAVNRSLRMTDKQQEQTQKSSRGLWASMTRGAKSASAAIVAGARGIGTAMTAALGPIALVAGAIGSLVLAARQFLGGAVDVESATRRLRTALEGVGAEVDRNTERLGRQARQISLALGRSRAEIIDLQREAIRMGVAVENVGTEIQRALDLSASTGIEASDALKALRELAAGDAGAIEQLYPHLRKFTDQATKLAEAQSAVAATGGAAAANLGTLSGAWQVFTNRLKDLGIVVGQSVLPELTRLLQDLSTNQDLWQSMAISARVLTAAMNAAARAIGALAKRGETLFSVVNPGYALGRAARGLFGGGGEAAGTPAAAAVAGGGLPTPAPAPAPAASGGGGFGGFMWNNRATAGIERLVQLAEQATGGGIPASAS